MPLWNALVKFHNEGFVAPPPPCLNNKSFYSVMSENAMCRSAFGRIGLAWGEKWRSPLMFWAFVVSWLAMIMLCVAMASVSTSASSVRSVPLWTGTIYILGPNTQGTGRLHTLINFYAGMTTIVSDGCSPGSECPQSWDGFSCSKDLYSNCNECVEQGQSFMPNLVMAFLTQIPQILTDFQRSTVAGDLLCMKAFGIVPGLFGLITTIAALNAFADSCHDKFGAGSFGQDGAASVFVHTDLGLCYYLLLWATWLKVFDIFVHIVVPIPEQGYWTPEGPGTAHVGADKGIQMQRLVDGAEKA